MLEEKQDACPFLCFFMFSGEWLLINILSECGL